MRYKNLNQNAGRPTKFSAEAIASIYASGISASETGRLLGIHHTTVLTTLKRLGIDTSQRLKAPQPSTMSSRADAARKSLIAVERLAAELRTELALIVDAQRNAVEIPCSVRAKLKEMGAPPDPRFSERAAQRAVAKAKIERMLQISARLKGRAA